MWDFNILGVLAPDKKKGLDKMDIRQESYREYCDRKYRQLRAELDETGRSRELENVREDVLSKKNNEGKIVYNVGAYAVLKAVHQYYCESGREANFQDKYNPNIPGIFVKVSEGAWRSYAWQEAEREPRLEFEASNLVAMLDEILAEARRRRQKTNPQAAKAAAPAGGAANAAPRGDEEELRRQLEEKELENGRLRNQMKQLQENLAVMQRTNDELRNREDAARAERGRLLDDARTEAARIVADAQTQAAEVRAHRLGEWDQERQSLLQAASAECESMREAARQECGAHREAVNRDCVEMERQTKAQCAEMIAEAERQAGENARRAAVRYLAAEQARSGMEQCAEQPAQPAQQAERLNGLRDEMLESSSAIQRQMVRQMDEIEQKLLEVKHGIEDELVGWRRSFFREKYYNLANCYATLYRQTGANSRIARMIAREALSLAEADEAERANAPAGPEQAASAPEAKKPAGSEYLADLKALHKNMLALQRNLETAMGRLGLYVVIPQEGEPFADEWHVLEDEAEQAAEGTPIAACITPAVGCRGSDGQGGECILRAAVTVKRAQ